MTALWCVLYTDAFRVVVVLTDHGSNEWQSKEADVVTGKRKKVAGGFKPTEKKRKKIDFGIQATKGRFKRGVLDVSKL